MKKLWPTNSATLKELFNVISNKPPPQGYKQRQKTTKKQRYVMKSAQPARHKKMRSVHHTRHLDKKYGSIYRYE